MLKCLITVHKQLKSSSKFQKRTFFLATMTLRGKLPANYCSSCYLTTVETRFLALLSAVVEHCPNMPIKPTLPLQNQSHR